LTTSTNISTGYGALSATDDGMSVLAKSKITSWKGPDVESIDKLRTRVKMEFEAHKCSGVLDGSDKSDGANKRGIYILGKMCDEYIPAFNVFNAHFTEKEFKASAYEVWKALESSFPVSVGMSGITTLDKSYKEMNMKAHWNPSRFISDMKLLRNRLESAGQTISEKQFVFDVVSKLPIEYSAATASLLTRIQSKDPKVPYPTLVEVQREIAVVYDVLTRHGVIKQPKKKGKTTETEAETDKSLKVATTKICFDCEEEGHFKDQCPYKEKIEAAKRKAIAEYKRDPHADKKPGGSL
jgi:hypothetical protein